jgi:UDP-galactopyranose mutase
MFDYIIVGAGLAGSVMAERIANELDKKVLIIEKRDHIGGNCYDEVDENGVIRHCYGPHLFHAKSEEAFKYLKRFGEWSVYNHRVLAYVDGKKVPIPFNFNTIRKLFPKELAKKYKRKLLEHYEYGKKVPILELIQQDDEDLQYLAQFVYEKIFVNYSAKQWGMKPEDMSGAVTARVPICVSRDDRYSHDKYQAVPKRGYTSIFKSMLSHKNIKLMINTDFHEVMTIKDNDFYFFDKKFEGKVIFTGQIDDLFDYKFGDLPYRSVDMHFETENMEFYQEAATVNYPNDYDFTRITEFKHIHPVKSERTTILKEYPQPYIKGKNTPYYPIFTQENQKRYKKYLEYSKNFKNLILIGRLAEYRYYDMDGIVIKALETFKESIVG